MSEPQAEQLALAGLAPRKRRKRVTHAPATHDPVAQVVLDVQATHLGQTFDYLVDEKDDEAARPGVMVRVRFGGRRVNGIIWARVKESHAAASSLRYLERVVTPEVLVSASMRRDITAIAEAYGGTPANILRLAVPPRVARIDKEQQLAMGGSWQGSRGQVTIDAKAIAEGETRMLASYDNALALRDALKGGGFASFVADALPGAGRWARDLAWMAASSLDAGRAAVLVLPTMREVRDMARALQRLGLKPFRKTTATHGGFDGDFALLSAAMAPAERYRSYLAAASGQVRCVIGTRAAMYAPVEGPGLFAIVDDVAYQNADGMMPYAAARGVLRLRAKAHAGVFVAFCNARSAISEWEISEADGRAEGVWSAIGSTRNMSVSRDGRDGLTGSGKAHADTAIEDFSADDGPMTASNELAAGQTSDASTSMAAVVGAGASEPNCAWSPDENDAETGTQKTTDSNAAGHVADVRNPYGGADEPILETGETYPLRPVNNASVAGNSSVTNDNRGQSADNADDTGTNPALADQREFSIEPECRPKVCETPVSGFSVPVHPLPAVVGEERPWIRWLNRDELARLADPSIGARVPHIAVRILSEALERGPILFSIPQDGIAEVLSCARCHRQARCPRCTGPLQQIRGEEARCRWCGAPVGEWSCPQCHGTRMSVVRVGAAGTASELQRLFRNMPMVLSSPSQPGGVVEVVPSRPMIVIATPGAEPRVRAEDGRPGEYAAVAILDAWTSLYAPGVDARIDALTAWMRVAAMCAKRADGGQVLLIGETDPMIARALVDWDSRILAARELDERAETGLSPVYAVACVWGRRDAVTAALRNIGAMDGDWATLKVDADELPAVLGPVPIPQPRTMDARELEATQDRVKAVVRVPQTRRAELARRLHVEVARHVATRTPGELRFQLDPKDLT
ncbi:primosomal protein N' [Bifidobacterium sp. ESL0790]|uniref:primosomal protein N' n=1 Tax=Bifidobacterium sp. ESL0790 TaxID=2983233 RepID=UPI0023F6CAD4|nr:primosomal protein N' [Bifidobacterium sp. ESL0790]WEV71884.1 primosomal protein N' [Bifidobacterium sp. ESL0790]